MPEELLLREDSERRGQQFHQSAFALEMDVLRSHHLVINPSGSTDYRELNLITEWPLVVLNLPGKGGTRNMHPCDSQVEGAAVSPPWLEQVPT